jgi:colanic acid/amylovoran biosynthesis protein
MANVHSQKPSKICLIGAPIETNNRGVSALASSLVRLITDLKPEAKISFFMGYPEMVVKRHNFAGKEVEVKIINYRLSPRAKWGEHVFILLALAALFRLLPMAYLRSKFLNWNDRLKHIGECDFVGAFNGGDSFSDIYGLARYFFTCFPMLIAIFLGKKLVLLPQTFGPYKSRISRAIAKWIIGHSSMVLSRDRESILLLRDLMKRSSPPVQAQFCPDVAFTLPSASMENLAIYPRTGISKNFTWIGMNVSGLLFHGGYTGNNMFGLRFEYRQFILELVEKLLAEDDRIRILFIPHTYGQEGNVNSDPIASLRVFEALQNRYEHRLFLLTGNYKEHELKGIIGRCDFFIGSRMHACIAAISQGVPTAALAYSDKFKGVFESIGLENLVVDGRRLDLNEAASRLIALFRSRKLENGHNQKIFSAQKRIKEMLTLALTTMSSAG